MQKYRPVQAEWRFQGDHRQRLNQTLIPCPADVTSQAEKKKYLKFSLTGKYFFSRFCIFHTGTEQNFLVKSDVNFISSIGYPFWWFTWNNGAVFCFYSAVGFHSIEGRSVRHLTFMDLVLNTCHFRRLYSPQCYRYCHVLHLIRVLMTCRSLG